MEHRLVGRSDCMGSVSTLAFGGVERGLVGWSGLGTLLGPEGAGNELLLSVSSALASLWGWCADQSSGQTVRMVLCYGGCVGGCRVWGCFLSVA
jgi:hypothetical protein